MIIHGYDFAFSTLNAADIERLEAAKDAYQKKSQAEQKRAEREQLSYADTLRCQCRTIMQFIDEVFGSGASAKLGLDGSDFGKAISILTEIKAAFTAEKKDLQDAMMAPQNREQRRKKHKNDRHAVSFPAQAPAEELVARVDKKTRREQLLRELAALEND